MVVDSYLILMNLGQVLYLRHINYFCVIKQIIFQGCEVEGNVKNNSQVKFLPAYKDISVQKMMEDQSPRAVWHHSSRTVHRSQSTRTRSPHTPSPYYYNNSGTNSRLMAGGSNTMSSSNVHVPHGRIYTPSPQQFRPFNTLSRSRPSNGSIRVNDGTHPRMPMRAMQPQTYHGVPVHLQAHAQRHTSPTNYDNNYGTVRRNLLNSQSPSQPMNYNHKAQSHGDMRGHRSRLYSDNSSPSHQQVDRHPQVSASIRNSNSEPDIEQAQPKQRQMGRAYRNRMHNTGNYAIPSGTYVASSSMTNIPQFAQLMPPTLTSPSRSDSFGTVQRPHALSLSPDLPTDRHKHNSQNSAYSSQFSSYEDVFNDSSLTRTRGSTTPTSPVGRQPSYLTAMNSPLKHRKIISAVYTFYSMRFSSHFSTFNFLPNDGCSLHLECNLPTIILFS